MKGFGFLTIVGGILLIQDAAECTDAENHLAVQMADKNMHRLLGDLVAYSHKEVRPMRNLSDTLTIALSLKLHNIVNLDFQKRILTSRITLEQVWNNYLMRWVPEEYGGIKHTILPAHKLWLPDIALYNSAAGKAFFSGQQVVVYYTGYVEWRSTETIHSSCELTTVNYPTDEQHCYYKFGSWVYDAVQLDIQHKSGRLHLTLEENTTTEGKVVAKVWKVAGTGIDLTEFTISTKWNITKTEAINHHKLYTCCNEPYAGLTFKLTLRRNLGVYKTPETMTWILLTILPILVFLVPVQSNQKLTLAAVNFLLLLIVITSSANQKDSQIFLMNRFYMYTLILDFITICGVVVVVSTYSRSTQMFKILKKILPILGKVTFVETLSASGNSTQITTENQTSSENESPGIQCIAKFLKHDLESETRKTSWQNLSNILNRLCLCVIGIISFIEIIAFIC